MARKPRKAVSMNIHLIIPFSRPENKDKLIEAYRPMGVILHPIMFEDEAELFDEPWIQATTMPQYSKDCHVMMPGCYKRNWFIRFCEIIDDDYYVTVDDDDMYEANVFDEIRKMDDDIVIISMKRGHRIPKGAVSPRDYPTDTLFAYPENVELGSISAQQSFVKGKIFKKHLHNEEFHCWDGELAVHHKVYGEQIAYRPDLFAMFNYYEPGRWDKGPKVVFGCMINDIQRFNMVLRQSQINSPLMYVSNPESATKGLNILLEKAEGESADICVLVHQDVYLRQGWVDQLRYQIKMLPDNWVCAGVIGKDASGLVCGKFHDMRIPDHFNTSDIHSFPHEACCFDEAVIIINMKKKFRFDTGLTGFDLYGTLAVLQAWEAGLKAYVLDLFTEHYCMRPFTWFPSEEFRENYKRLHDRYSAQWKLDSTALGLSPDATERLEQIRAFMTSVGPEVEAA
jgi:hypothetical protein